MKNNQLIVLFYSVAVLLGITSLTATTAAAEGGRVTTHGRIIFYEELEDGSDSSSEPSDSSEPLKPIGRFPNTGELLTGYSALSGGILLLVLVIFFLRKRRKEGR